MPVENETQSGGSFAGQLVQGDADAPPPPPPMPEPDVPSPAPPTGQEPGTPPATPDQASSTGDPAAGTAPEDTTMAVPAEKPAEKADGWQVDPYRLRAFTDAVMRARTYLDSVQAKVDRMQGEALTPQLGTSPVGTQLAKKFDDRLNSTVGLRTMLTEAMKRMDDFVASAEKAARVYEENEESAVVTFTAATLEPPPVNRG